MIAYVIVYGIAAILAVAVLRKLFRLIARRIGRQRPVIRIRDRGFASSALDAARKTQVRAENMEAACAALAKAVSQPAYEVARKCATCGRLWRCGLDTAEDCGPGRRMWIAKTEGRS